jgi:cyclopropane fatty-acyl-phospholipid synthase-like methyltransferase
MLPFSDACERNKDPILEVLRGVLSRSCGVLEIGSGTGQHAVYFAAHLGHLFWHPSEQRANLAALGERVRAEPRRNLRAPIELEVCQANWPAIEVDAVFSANTLHIMSFAAVECFFAGVGRVLPAHGHLCVYGPFRYQGHHTSPSNQQFDQMLRSRDSASGLRDMDEVKPLAAAHGLQLLADHDQPANNRLLVFARD